MAFKEKSPELEIHSAVQFRGSLTMEGVRDNAFRVVEDYCKKNGMEPGEFLSHLGMMRNDKWKQEGDWRKSVDLNSLNPLIFRCIPAKEEDGMVVGRRFEAGQFSSLLKDMEASYVANAVPKRIEKAPIAPAPDRQEYREAAKPLQDSQMPPAIRAKLFSRGEGILDRFPKLDEDMRTTIQGIVGRGGVASTRRREEVNLTGYLRNLSNDRHAITDAEATRIYDAFMGPKGALAQAEREVRESREPLREMFAQAERREIGSPARTYRYSFTVATAGEAGKVLSTFNIDSPKPIGSLHELGNIAREHPDGLTVSRIASGGRTIAVTGDQLELFGSRVVRLSYDDRYLATLNERKRG